MSSKFKDDIYLFDNIKEEIQPKNLRKLLNLNFMKTANETRRVGEYDLPYILSSINMYPDFIALYGEFSKYKLTYRTCVAFYEYDQVFDGIKGIWNAIYHDIRKWQFYYLNRFAGVKYFIAPDYSLCGDVNKIENLHRLFRARIVSIWLTMNLKVPVIPNITYSNPEIFPNMLDGMEDCEIVAFSTKGLMKSADARNLLRESIKFTVDNLKKLKAIIVYTVSIFDETIYDLFSYAADNGVRLIIPRNTLRDRNIFKWEESNGKIHS